MLLNLEPVCMDAQPATEHFLVVSYVRIESSQSVHPKAGP